MSSEEVLQYVHRIVSEINAVETFSPLHLQPFFVVLDVHLSFKKNYRSQLMSKGHFTWDVIVCCIAAVLVLFTNFLQKSESLLLVMTRKST